MENAKVNAKILIVEGTSGVGKSTSIDELLRKYISENEKIRSLMHLTQAHTYGPLARHEDDNSLTPAMNIAHLNKIFGILDWCVSCVQYEKKVKFFCIADTMHLTHCVRPGVINFSHVQYFDDQLRCMNCKRLFIKAYASTIWERGITPRKDEQFLCEYGKKFGKNLEEQHQYFVDEQEQMEQLYERSSINKLSIKAEENISMNVETAYDFWLQ